MQQSSNVTLSFIDSTIDIVSTSINQLFQLIFCLLAVATFARIVNFFFLEKSQFNSNINEQIQGNNEKVIEDIKKEETKLNVKEIIPQSSGWESESIIESVQPQLEVSQKVIKQQLKIPKRKCMSVGPILLTPNSQIIRKLNVEEREERYRYDILPLNNENSKTISQLTPLSSVDINDISEPRSTPLPQDVEDFQYTDSPDTSSLYGSEDEEQEDVSQYRRGGYHPISLGDILHNRYRVVRKLGWGHFSTVWLCRDIQEEKYVAMKIVKSAQHYAETAADEIRLLEVIRDADPFDSHHDRIVKLLNHFTVRGVNGIHTCLVFEALGCSLYKLIVKNNYQGLVLSQVKSIIKQIGVLKRIFGAHISHIIHTDIKPENILIVMDNAATINQQIDEAIKDLKGKGYSAHWFPDSYVSTFEKSSKKSSSPPPSSLLAPPLLSNYNLNEIHDSQSTPSTTTTTHDNKNSNNNPIANSIESDDDAVIGATSSSTTSSSFLDGKRISSFEEKRGSNGSLETDAGINDSNRYRTEFQQRKGSISIICNSQLQSTSGEKTKLPFKLSKLSSKQISYSGVLQSLLNNPNIKVKIADLGNACFDHYHFTDDIQTRQYRSIEILLGIKYSYSADIWSTACLAFELATGDYLFDPHSGENYSRDEDHLAHIIELIGEPIPQSLIMKGKHGLKYFTSYGNLRHITKLKTWSLYNVLLEKYEWSPEDARQFADFILPISHSKYIRIKQDKGLNQQQQKKQKPVCIVKPFKVENKNTNNHVRPSQTQRNQESSSFVSWIGENVWKIAFGVAVVAGGAILMTSKGRSGNDNDEDDD
ncbi:hypothetical protein PVAND_017582 [Polypedilum vanderplanki]|uniref:non-specific serine/threonine protein kinase n=1 Tax=Polypedilum vanderplanki TaxID=319348 RepID=A0A9J6BIQ2_POLVA|nr:hypothetical protein PVAND_017582 [Polypedilum vanderplanki]